MLENTDSNEVLSNVPTPPSHEDQMDHLKAMLEDIRESIEIRDLLMECADNLPDWQPDMYLLHTWQGWDWKLEAGLVKRKFQNLTDEIQETEQDLEEQMVCIPRWLDDAEKLQRGTLNFSEKVNAERVEVQPGVLKEGWSWEQEEGSGPGLMDEVDPKDTGNENPNEGDDGVGEITHKIREAQL